MPKIWAALPLRGADPHREKFLLLVEVVVRMNGAISDFIAEALGFLYFILAAMNFRQICQESILRDSVFYIGNEKLVKSRIPKFCF